jgi:hypothetical protein
MAVLPPTRACNSPNIGFNLVLRRLEVWFGKYAFFSGIGRILFGKQVYATDARSANKSF